ncbi:MAG TPA: AAA family ATPase [Gemmatimonadales bacterium]|nr:AAA family ATPase [Gemmatimonadales bacterium]
MPQAIVTSAIPVLRTLGELQFEGGAAGLSSPRIGLALLAYLARRSPRPVDRGELADLFWRERDPAKARQSLRQVLLELKRLVGHGLQTEHDQVSLAAETLVLDATCFEGHVRAGRWREAVAAWHGEFLSRADNLGGEDFRLWLETERETLRGPLRLALRELVKEARGNSNWQEGSLWAQRWVDLLPLEEEGQRHLIELAQLEGRTAEALARFNAFRAQLRAIDSMPTPGFLQLGAVLERDAAGGQLHHTPGSAALFTPDLTGRGQALTELSSVWRAVRAGTPAAILVEGDAGIGKSRLCEEFLRRVAAEGNRPTVLRARGYETTPHTSLDALAELVIGLVNAPGASGASAATLGELARLAPALRDRFPSLPRPSDDGRGLEDALVDVLSAVAAERPVVLYIDDLPLAHPATQQVLMAVSGRVAAPLLLLVTARTGEERTAAYVELSSRAGIRRLKLQPLGLRDIELLLGSMLELAPPARHALAERLYGEGAGNPFYTIELTAALVDEGQLLPTDAGAWRLEPGDNGKPIPLPATIREAVRRRLDRMTPEVRAVVDAAAVLGRTFDSRMLPAVSGLGATACAVGVEELLARRMVREQPGTPGVYEFTHEIICRVAYDLLAASRREALHLAAVRSWEPRSGEGEASRSSLAYHRARAGSRSRRWRSRAAMVGIGSVMVAGAAGFFLMPASQRANLRTLLTRSAPTLSSRRVVVAPLTNHTGDSTLTGIGALAADWIAQGLMRTTQFEVVDPRTASVASRIVEHIPALFRDGNRAIAVAEETGSGTVLSGDLFREGDTLRVLIQIIDVATGKVVRTVGPVNGPANTPSRLVTSLGERVVAAVASAVDTTSRGFSAGLGIPPSYDAYNEVSRAWESFFRGDYKDTFERLDHASSLDTSYMAPLLMRAYVETRLDHWPAVDTLVRRLTGHQRTLTPAERAVLNGLRADLRGDLWGRLRAARELVDLTPASVEGYTLAASTALMINRPRESLTILSKVDPDRGLLLVAPFYWESHTSALHRLGERAAELESARRAVRRFPDRFWPHVNLLLALAAAGDVKGARRELPRPTRDDPYVSGPRQAALWVWRELRVHEHDAAAARWLETLVEETPASVDTTLAGRVMEGDIQYAARQWENARQHYAAGLAQHPRNPMLLGRLGATAARMGDRTEALRLSGELAGLSIPHLFGSQTYARARISAALGDRADAVELLQEAWIQGRPLAFDGRDAEDVHSDPAFESLREFVPFQALMRTD